MSTRIVVVEDEGIIALDLKARLEQAGYLVVATADNSEDALASVEKFKPGLVLMDIHLQGMVDGVETAARIRQDFHIPVIFATAYADRETLNRARITEPFGYIVKPFHGVDFRAQIEIALWKHSMEQKLRVSEAWISMTFRNVADSLIATDQAGNIAVMNLPAAKLTGWEPGEAKGKPLAEIFKIFDSGTGLPLPLSVSNGRSECILARESSQGVVIEYEISCNSDGGQEFGVIIAFRDITERKKAEQQERQLQKVNALGLMATGLGRELAESQNKMDDSVKQLIERSEGSTLRLVWDVYERAAHQQSIVQQVITLGRNDAGITTVLDLNRALKDLQSQLAKALGNHRNLILNLEPGVHMVETDPLHLRENLHRLIADARQATPRGATVQITTSTVTLNGKIGVRLSVRDERKVAPGTAKERMFDPYYQSSPGKSNPGFSLALVCRYMAMNGGSIDVEAAPGEGAAYLLNFPAVQVSVQAKQMSLSA